MSIDQSDVPRYSGGAGRHSCRNETVRTNGKQVLLSSAILLCRRKRRALATCLNQLVVSSQSLMHSFSVTSVAKGSPCRTIVARLRVHRASVTPSCSVLEHCEHLNAFSCGIDRRKAIGSAVFAWDSVRLILRVDSFTSPCQVSRSNTYQVRANERHRRSANVDSLS